MATVFVRLHGAVPAFAPRRGLVLPVGARLCAILVAHILLNLYVGLMAVRLLLTRHGCAGSPRIWMTVS